MKVRFLRTVGQRAATQAADNPNSPVLPKKDDGTMYQEGEVADLKDADAQACITVGVAEPAGDDKPAPHRFAAPKAADKGDK